MALVSARTPAFRLPERQLSSSGETDSKIEDPDLERAFKLIRLHQDVKMKHVQGQDQGLAQARRDVKETMERLRREGRI